MEKDDIICSVVGAVDLRPSVAEAQGGTRSRKEGRKLQ
jgi:hypothetical protein